MQRDQIETNANDSPQQVSGTQRDEKVPILEMRDVALRGTMRADRLRQVNFSIRAGELVLIKRSTGNAKQLLASAALGLVSPSRGEVMVEGTGWKQVRFQQRLEMRSRIGRVFDDEGWLLGLSVLDNILLTERHHRMEDEASLISRMKQLFSEFGISIPTRAPANAEPWKMQICQWVRALLGQPRLIVLERPLQGVPMEYHAAFLAAEKQFRKRGGGTLWITDQRRVLNHPQLQDATHLEARDQNLVPFRTGDAS